MSDDYGPAQFVGSPNFDAGRRGHRVEAIVIHTEAGFETGTIRTFQDPARRASAHYSIGLDGSVHQYVWEADTAWHAGDYDENLRTIGIEREDRADPAMPMSAAQADAWQRLVAHLCEKYAIPLRLATAGGAGLIPHHLINPDHAGCPGPGVLYVAGLLIAHGGHTPSTPRRRDMVSIAYREADDTLWKAIVGPAQKDGSQHVYVGPLGADAYDCGGNARDVSLTFTKLGVGHMLVEGAAGELYHFTQQPDQTWAEARESGVVG